jgi:ABC-type sugar transport system permease subunit
MVYPIIEAFRLSFFMSNGTLEKWVGLNNYRIVLQSEAFWKGVYTTFFTGFFQLLIAIPLGFTIACLINGLKRGKDFYKSLFFIPYITSIIAAAMIFRFVLHPDMGLLNFLLAKLGLPTSAWLAQPTTARWGVVILGVWHWLGFVVIISLANLQAISSQLYEAASIDGASKWQQWVYITIPNMVGTFAFLLVMGWIECLQRFSETYVLGGLQGSPARSVYTIVGFIYERGFGGNEFGVASAAAFILFIIILLFTMVNMKLSKMRV